MTSKFTFTLLFAFSFFTQSVAQTAGQPDVSFNSTGFYAVDFGFIDNAQHVMVQPDQKIVATGVALTPAFSGVLQVIRLNPDGTPDSNFGNGGVFSFAAPNAETYGVASQITTNGKILVGGLYINTTTYYADFLLLRLESDGTLDPTFGDNGIVIFEATTQDDLLQSMVLQSDGKIVIAGSVSEVFGFDIYNAPCIVRFTEDGALDPSFGNNGITQFTPVGQDNELTSCQIQTDGKIVASGHFQKPLTGSADFDVYVVRVDTSGTPDVGFGDNGEVKTPVNGGVDDAFGMDIDQDGNIVVAGFTTAPVTLEFDMLMAKYKPNGELDANFGNAGTVIFDNTPYDVANDLKIQADGKILVAGAIGEFVEPKSFALWRYQPDGTPDEGFDGDGYATAEFVTQGNQEFNGLDIQSDGKIVACGKARVTNNDFIVARFHAETVTALSEPDANTYVNVYPNPSNGLFTFNMDPSFIEGALLKVFGMDGHLVLEKNISDATFTIHLDVPAGNYIYQIVNGKGNVNGKVVVRKS